MPQYYPNQDVICWVKAFITDAYEGALDEEQKTDLRKDFYKVIRGWNTESFIYDWAWNMIAVPFGIEDQFPETFVSALRNSWMASVDDHKDNPKQFSDELKDMFDEDATERNCPECEEWFEPEKDWDDDCCPRCREEDDEENEKDKETCTARCENPGTVTITDQNGKECLVCKDCHDCFKKIEGYMAEQKAFEAEEAEKKVHMCKSCNEVMENSLFEKGKMCCDKPLFDDDEEVDGFICEGCKETKEPDGHEVSCDECGKDHGCSECNGTWTVRERHFCEDCNTGHGCEMFCCDECGNEGLENDDTCYAMDGTFCNEGCLQNYIDLMREEAEKKVNLTVGA